MHALRGLPSTARSFDLLLRIRSKEIELHRYNCSVQTICGLLRFDRIRSNCFSLNCCEPVGMLDLCCYGMFSHAVFDDSWRHCEQKRCWTSDCRRQYSMKPLKWRWSIFISLSCVWRFCKWTTSDETVGADGLKGPDKEAAFQPSSDGSFGSQEWNVRECPTSGGEHWRKNRSPKVGITQPSFISALAHGPSSFVLTTFARDKSPCAGLLSFTDKAASWMVLLFALRAWTFVSPAKASCVWVTDANVMLQVVLSITWSLLENLKDVTTLDLDLVKLLAVPIVNFSSNNHFKK